MAHWSENPTASEVAEILCEYLQTIDAGTSPEVAATYLLADLTAFRENLPFTNPEDRTHTLRLAQALIERVRVGLEEIARTAEGYAALDQD